MNDLADVPSENMRLYEQLYRYPIHSEQRVKAYKMGRPALSERFNGSSSPTRARKRLRIFISTFVIWIMRKWTKQWIRLQALMIEDGYAFES